MSINENEQDLSLIKQVQLGNKQAFNTLVLKYQYRIYKLIARYIFDHSEILDITQETFIKVYKAISKFRAESAFYTWLYRIAINTAKNHIFLMNRRLPDINLSHEHSEIFFDKEAYKEESTPERTLISNEVEKVVFDVINELPHTLKDTILFRERDGMSYEEIATAMECPVGTVRSRIYRAREAIEKKVHPSMRP
ncbi:MAG: rpoE [Francisellaceae bacterium]|nr:rpoE [Francisellaceae bacterium]